MWGTCIDRGLSPPQAQPKKYEFGELFGDDYNVGKGRPQTFISILALRIQYRFPSPDFVKNMFSSPESERTPPHPREGFGNLLLGKSGDRRPMVTLMSALRGFDS